MSRPLCTVRLTPRGRAAITRAMAHLTAEELTAAVAALGVLFLRERADLWIQLIATAAALFIVSGILR